MLVYNDIKHSDDTLLRLNTLRKGSEFCDTILEVRESAIHPISWQIFKRNVHVTLLWILVLHEITLCHISIYSLFFQVEGHEVNAHRAILACASPFLFEMFSTESNAYQLDWKHHYKLENTDYDSFIILLNFIYTARLVANTGFHFQRDCFRIWYAPRENVKIKFHRSCVEEHESTSWIDVNISWFKLGVRHCK